MALCPEPRGHAGTAFDHDRELCPLRLDRRKHTEEKGTGQWADPWHVGFRFSGRVRVGFGRVVVGVGRKKTFGKASRVQPLHLEIWVTLVPFATGNCYTVQVTSGSSSARMHNVRFVKMRGGNLAMSFFCPVFRGAIIVSFGVHVCFLLPSSCFQVICFHSASISIYKNV